ncbi:alpha/beta fold hydrolase [Bradyrhizobium tropiciagri]|uniref:alpha/beta fold hydrolase n=1 Tax=Bradyrhizobium tropiciagri TaxID=312253 RepID=UPI00067D6D03|nr:alpha/beta hydrolase [Bradyrhizobium tropiciagri]
MSYAQTTGDVTHRTIQANGIHLHFVEQGDGPLVFLCHGFPELWYSWRYQLPALASAGFHAVALDMRGYGKSDRPEAIDQYTLLHLVGDMEGLLDALGVQQAVIAGHDWGAVVAWHAALLRPDRFRAVIALCQPYLPRSTVAPTLIMPRRKNAVFYQLYFQEPGVAEFELERDVRQTFLKVLGGWSAAGERLPGDPPVGMVSRDGGYLTERQTLASLPNWLTEADLDFYVREFERTGFRGGLNWYRNIDRNWELLASFEGAKVTVPALYMAGARDPALAFPGMDRVLASLANTVPQLRGKVILPDCGHWTQQERALEVSAAMIDFLRHL